MDGRVVSLRGRWRSLVAHLHDTQGVAGSSPARPTIVRDSRRPDVGPPPFLKGFRGFVVSNSRQLREYLGRFVEYLGRLPVHRTGCTALHTLLLACSLVPGPGHGVGSAVQPRCVMVQLSPA